MGITGYRKKRGRLFPRRIKGPPDPTKFKRVLRVSREFELGDWSAQDLKRAMEEQWNSKTTANAVRRTKWVPGPKIE